MKWDAKRRVYIDDQGKPIPPAKVRQWVDEYIDNTQAEIDSKTEELLSGTITVVVFFEFLKDTIISMHGASGVIAYGGQDRVNWERIGDKVASELDYLAKFETEAQEALRTSQSIARDLALAGNLDADGEERVMRAIMRNSVTDIVSAVRTVVPDLDVQDVIERHRLETLIWGEVGSRGRMYADAAYSTYENSVKAREGEAGAIGVRRVTEADKNVCDGCEQASTSEYVPMDEILDIGDAECVSNCRCHFEFSYHGIEPLTIERGIYANAATASAA